MKTFKRFYLAWLILASLAVVAGNVFLSPWLAEQNKISYVAHASDTPEDLAKAMIGKKVDVLKDEVVDDIAACETKGVKDPDGAIIFDTNNEASIGRLQFQRKTVIHYIEKFEDRDITMAQAVAIAIDPTQARSLAKQIMFEEEGGWRNWYNCGTAVNAGVRIGIINSL